MHVGPEEPTGGISTHVPTRGTTRPRRKWRLNCLFQPTSPRGGRHAREAHARSHIGFQPTSPRGGRPGVHCQERRETDFNPRPHAGDDVIRTTLVNREGISTHVPTRGTTRPAYATGGTGKFQPTSPRGGRRCASGEGARHHNFNPRPHAGDDLWSAGRCNRYVHFNPRPHAGDDCTESHKYDMIEKFQPTSPRGGRPSASGCSLQVRKFQPTSPRGGRLTVLTVLANAVYFNPRPHAGDD